MWQNFENQVGFEKLTKFKTMNLKDNNQWDYNLQKESENLDNRTNSENFDFNLTRINEKLNIHGLPLPVILTPNPSNCIIVDCLLKLFEQKEKDSELIEQQKVNFQRLKCDYNNLNTQSKEMEKKLISSIREIELLKQKNR